MSNEPPDHDFQDSDSSGTGGTAERPWIHLKTTHDVEAWINNYDWDLRRHVTQINAAGVGIRFCLEQGGDIVMHTTSEGEVLLDVTPEAQWVAPVITAATGVEAPDAQIWVLPGDVLTQLVLGLSGLIASSRPVIDHPFNTKKKQRINW
jgi:putative hemolysin